jgi:hypothetical protein
MAALALVGCGDVQPPTAPPTPIETTDGEEPPARTQLRALAAAAADRRFSAAYTLSTAGRPDRTVVVTLAADGTWRIDIPGWAAGGTVDIAVARTADGLFQCTLAGWSMGPSCVRVADPDGRFPADLDPRVQYLFTDWVRVLANRQAPLAVSIAAPLPGSSGTCFSIESTSASLNPPLDVGIYCYDAEGTLTAARLALGTLVLSGAPSPAPPSVTLPGPVVAAEPVGTAPPPPPVTTATATPVG